GGGPKHFASCVDLAECPVLDDELAGRIGPLPPDLPRDAVSGRWMNELAASRGDLGPGDDQVEPWIEQVEDEATVRAEMGPQCRQRLPLCGGREHELEDPAGRHDEREVAPEREGPHVRSMEREAGPRHRPTMPLAFVLRDGASAQRGRCPRPHDHPPRGPWPPDPCRPRPQGSVRLSPWPVAGRSRCRSPPSWPRRGPRPWRHTSRCASYRPHKRRGASASRSWVERGFRSLCRQGAPP